MSIQNENMPISFLLPTLLHLILHLCFIFTRSALTPPYWSSLYIHGSTVVLCFSHLLPWLSSPLNCSPSCPLCFPKLPVITSPSFFPLPGTGSCGITILYFYETLSFALCVYGSLYSMCVPGWLGGGLRRATNAPRAIFKSHFTLLRVKRPDTALCKRRKAGTEREEGWDRETKGRKWCRWQHLNRGVEWGTWHGGGAE